MSLNTRTSTKIWKNCLTTSRRGLAPPGSTLLTRLPSTSISVPKKGDWKRRGHKNWVEGGARISILSRATSCSAMDGNCIHERAACVVSPKLKEVAHLFIHVTRHRCRESDMTGVGYPWPRLRRLARTVGNLGITRVSVLIASIPDLKDTKPRAVLKKSDFSTCRICNAKVDHRTKNYFDVECYTLKSSVMERMIVITAKMQFLRKRDTRNLLDRTSRSSKQFLEKSSCPL